MGPTAGDITPRLGARLVQEGNRLHYLAGPGQYFSR